MPSGCRKLVRSTFDYPHLTLAVKLRGARAIAGMNTPEEKLAVT